jgi:hypothetical protein
MMGRARSTNGETEYVLRISVGKPEEFNPLGISRHRCVDNMNMALGQIEWGGTVWTVLVQDSGEPL